LTVRKKRLNELVLLDIADAWLSCADQAERKKRAKACDADHRL
jgi:hypothetical protein